MTGRNLRKALWGFRRTLALAAVFSLVINLLMLTAPIYMLQVFDRVLQSRSSDTLIFLTLAAVLALLTLAVLEAVRSFLFIRLASWLDALLGPDLLAGGIKGALNRAGPAHIRGLKDVSTVRNFLTSPAISAFLDAPWTPIFLLVIFSLHTVLGALALIGAVALIAMALANEMLTRQQVLRAGMANIKSDFLTEASVRNADAVEAMGMRPGLIANWRRANDESRSAHAAAGARSAVVVALAKFLRFTLQVGILGAGALLVLQNELSAGGMIAASILMARALAPVDTAIGAWRNAVAARLAAARIKQQLRADPGEPESPELPNPKGHLVLRDLVFGYPGAREAMIKGITLEVLPGEVLGIVGPSAAGKTTLARLMVGNLAPSSGSLRLDGIELASWSARDKGRHLGYVPQDVELFKGTVQQNIARMGLPNQNADADAVIAAAEAAGVHEMILSLPKGYDTDIGDGGAVLSGGQRQRLAVARALYGWPRLLIYDEPNASLDHAGEDAFIQAMAGLKETGVAQVIISHKPSILRHTDKIMVMQDGRIQAIGPRDQIVAEIMRLQTRNAERLSEPHSEGGDHGG